MKKLIFGAILVPSQVNHIFLIKSDQQTTGIFLTLVYLNNLPFSAVSEPPDTYN